MRSRPLNYQHKVEKLKAKVLPEDDMKDFTETEEGVDYTQNDMEEYGEGTRDQEVKVEVVDDSAGVADEKSHSSAEDNSSKDLNSTKRERTENVIRRSIVAKPLKVIKEQLSKMSWKQSQVTGSRPHSQISGKSEEPELKKSVNVECAEKGKDNNSFNIKMQLVVGTTGEQQQQQRDGAGKSPQPSVTIASPQQVMQTPAGSCQNSVCMSQSGLYPCSYPSICQQVPMSMPMMAPPGYACVPQQYPYPAVMGYYYPPPAYAYQPMVPFMYPQYMPQQPQSQSPSPQQSFAGPAPAVRPFFSGSEAPSPIRTCRRPQTSSISAVPSPSIATTRRHAAANKSPDHVRTRKVRISTPSAEKSSEADIVEDSESASPAPAVQANPEKPKEKKEEKSKENIEPKKDPEPHTNEPATENKTQKTPPPEQPVVKRPPVLLNFDLSNESGTTPAAVAEKSTGCSLAEMFTMKKKLMLSKLVKPQQEQEDQKKDKPLHEAKSRTKEDILLQRKAMMQSKVKRAKRTPAKAMDCGKLDANGKKKETPEVLIARLAAGKRSSVSKEEMRRLTKKNYEQLPEVQSRREEERKKQERFARAVRARELEKVCDKKCDTPDRKE